MKNKHQKFFKMMLQERELFLEMSECPEEGSPIHLSFRQKWQEAQDKVEIFLTKNRSKFWRTQFEKNLKKLAK